MNAHTKAIAQALVGSAFTIGLLDFVWLFLRNKYHKSLIQAIQKSPLSIRVIPAALVYVLIPVILFLTAVSTSSTFKDAAYKGALTGCLLYAFYDLTNYSILKDYTLEMTIGDISWGTLLCTLGAVAGYFFYRR